MSEQSPEMLAALQALLAQAQQPTAAAGQWNQPQPGALPTINGISIPVKIETPIGSVRVDLHLPAECGQSPAALMAAIQGLANAGYPVDAWQPRNQDGGNNWGGGGGNWGNGSNGGSYGNRSYGNRGGFSGGRRW